MENNIGTTVEWEMLLAMTLEVDDSNPACWDVFVPIKSQLINFSRYMYEIVYQ